MLWHHNIEESCWSKISSFTVTDCEVYWPAINSVNLELYLQWLSTLNFSIECVSLTVYQESGVGAEMETVYCSYHTGTQLKVDYDVRVIWDICCRHGHFFPHSQKQSLFKSIVINMKSLDNWRFLTFKVRFCMEYHFKVATLWGFILYSMQYLADHVHEWCQPTACRYRRTAKSLTRIQSTHNLQ